MRRRWWAIIVLVIIAMASIVLIKDFLKTPSGSLYYIGKAIHEHDAELFLTYVDYAAILNQLTPEPSSGVLQTMAHNTLVQLKEKAPAYIARIIEDENRPNPPSSWALLLSVTMGGETDGRVEVMVSDLNMGSRDKLRFIMLKYPDGRWRIAQVNSADLEWLVLFCAGLVQ